MDGSELMNKMGRERHGLDEQFSKCRLQDTGGPPDRIPGSIRSLLHFRTNTKMLLAFFTDGAEVVVGKITGSYHRSKEYTKLY